MTASPDAFVPLALTAAPHGKAEEFRVLVAPSPEKARPLRDLSLAVAGLAAGPGHRTNSQPRVLLQRDGERVTGIQIQCSCGQIIDLKCEYSDGTATAPPDHAGSLPCSPA